MRISFNWLSDYLDLSGVSPAEFAEVITTRVAEVESVERSGGGLGPAHIVQVLSVKSHPRKQNLIVCELSGGATVVCGDVTVKKGQFVAYLPPGGEIVAQGDRPARKVESREIEGVLSAGLLVSEAELGLSTEHGGVLRFSDGEATGADQKKVVVGAPLSSIVGGVDTVLVIDNKSLTHRPDLWCHLGFARELSAILERPLRVDFDRWADDSPDGAALLAELGLKNEPQFQTSIEKGAACRRFAALQFSGVSHCSSPLWLRRRLFSVGAGVRSLLVDLSNYVMLDIGQPNHAYDRAKLTGNKISARKARGGEPFVGLDGVERRLSESDMVIADGSGAVALAGIIGGQATAVSETTTELLLESANFDGTVVRQTAKRLALRTDASNRFEKGLTPYQVPLALHRYGQLLQQLERSAKITAYCSDCFVERPAATSIAVPAGAIFNRLVSDSLASDSRNSTDSGVPGVALGRAGEALTPERIVAILKNLGFSVDSSRNGELMVGVPYFRAGRDVSILEDLVEEVGRVHGYEKIPEAAPLIESSVPKLQQLKCLEYQLGDLLAANGFSEIYGYSFVNPNVSERFGYPVLSRDSGQQGKSISLEPGAVQLENPIDAEQTHIRTSLVPGVVHSLVRNGRHERSVLIYEVGRGYQHSPPASHEALVLKRVDKNAAAYERRLLAIGCCGACPSDGGAPKFIASGRNFYLAVSVVERILRLVSVKKPVLVPLGKKAAAVGAGEFQLLRGWMHPHRAAQVILNGVSLGVIAEVRPELIADIPERSVVAELDLDLLLEADSSELHFTPLAKFPDSLFEISVVMPERTHFSELSALLERAVPEGRLRGVELLDVYSGKPLKAGEKSVSVRLAFGAPDRTLSTEELQLLQNGVMNSVEKGSYSLRR